MVKYFIVGRRYRHSLPYALFDIEIDKILRIKPDFVRLRVKYLRKESGIVVMTGKGLYGDKDYLRILKKDYAFWTPVFYDWEPIDDPVEEARVLSLREQLCERP